MPGIKKISLIVLTVFGLGLGVYFGNQKAISVSDVDKAFSHLPKTSWENLDGQYNQLTDWTDKILVVNHWAPWCAPCRQEIPLFMQLRREYLDQGVEFIGIAHDSKDIVRRYVDSMGIQYPQLWAGEKQGMEWMKTLGNPGSLPMTLIYDQKGDLRAKKIGLMSSRQLTQVIETLL